MMLAFALPVLALLAAGGGLAPCLVAEDPPPPAPVGRTERIRLTLAEGAAPITGEIDLYSIPGAEGGVRVLLVATEELPGLPLSSIRAPATISNPVPDLCDLSEGRVVRAVADWLEGQAMLAAEWWVAGSEGVERVRRPRLVPRSWIELRRTCTAGADGQLVLRLRLESPIIQEGTIRTELRELEWSFEGVGAGGIRRTEMRHTLLRAVDATEERLTSAVAIESLSAAPLDEAQVRAIGREYEILADATRRLQPGNSPEVIATAAELLAGHRSEFPQGRLAAVLPALEALLAKRTEESAGGTPDERAEKLIGKPAPDFRLDDIDGASVDLASFRGKPVVLSFWGYT